MSRLNVKEAAAYIPISIGTLNRLRVIGGGPRFIKFEKKVLYDVADLDKWLEARKQTSTADRPDSRRRAARFT